MSTIVHVHAQDVDLAALVRHAEAKDAQLMACLSYLVVASCGEGLVGYDQVARAYNVSEFTVGRWLRRLAELGLLKGRRVSEGVVEAEVVTIHRVENAQKCDLSEAPAPEPKKPAKAAPAQAQAAVQGLKSPSAKEKPAPNAIQAGRLQAALDTYQVCETMLARTRSAEEIEGALRAVVKNPMFGRVDLPKELLDADAWLVQSRKGYTDMGRFLTNWLRNAAKSRRAPGNANPSPDGKYDELAARAKGAA